MSDTVEEKTITSSGIPPEGFPQTELNKTITPEGIPQTEWSKTPPEGIPQTEWDKTPDIVKELCIKLSDLKIHQVKYIHKSEKMTMDEALKEYEKNTLETYNEHNCLDWYAVHNFIRGHKQALNNEKSDGFFHYLVWYFTMLDLKFIKIQYKIYLEAKNIILTAYPNDKLFEQVEKFKTNENVIENIKTNLWDWSKQWPKPDKAQFHMYFKAYYFQGNDTNFQEHILGIIDDRHKNKYQYKTVLATARLYKYFYPTNTDSIAHYISSLTLDDI
jgi:hypothetical protein